MDSRNNKDKIARIRVSRWGGEGGDTVHQTTSPPFGAYPTPDIYPTPLSQYPPLQQKFSRCARINTAFPVLKINVIPDQSESSIEHHSI